MIAIGLSRKSIVGTLIRKDNAMHRARWLSALCVAASMIEFVSAPASAALSLAGLYNTGFDSAGSLVTAGGVDGNYKLVSAPYVLGSTNADVTNPASPYWVPNDTVSQWITPDGYQNPPHSDSGGNPNWPATAPQGLYVYDLTFFVPAAYVPYLSITGQWASDNPAEMRLNPVVPGSGSPDGLLVSDTPGWPSSDNQAYQSWTGFSIASGFVAGWNVLEFTVNNLSGSVGNPSGLDVRFAAPAVPEAGSLTAWSVLGLFVAGWSWRRKR
jgi:hypothetical protein